MKICMIFNKAVHYRSAIYRTIDDNFECDWYLGHSSDEMSPDTLKSFTFIETIQLGKHFKLQRGVLKLSCKKDYDSYLMTGELYNITTWLFCLLNRLFHHSSKLYFWTHGFYGKESWIRKLLKKIFFQMADGIFLYGNYARNLMIKEGFSPDKLFVIHNSLAYEQQLALRKTLVWRPIYNEHFGNDDCNLIFIGRLTTVKHLDILIRAIKLLLNQGKCYNLTFIGDGVERENLIELSKELGLLNRIWFYGACFDETINAEFIYNADLCVSPGNVGLTAMHCMVFGTPVLTHNSFPYQMPEFEAIHEGKTGAFFEYGNVESLARKISQWCEENKGCREQIRQACYHEIDTQWTPQFQIEVLKQHLK